MPISAIPYQGNQGSTVWGLVANTNAGPLAKELRKTFGKGELSKQDYHLSMGYLLAARDKGWEFNQQRAVEQVLSIPTDKKDMMGRPVELRDHFVQKLAKSPQKSNPLKTYGVDKTNSVGKAALHLAVVEPGLWRIKALLSFGANRLNKSRQGQRPYDLVSKQVEYLEGRIRSHEGRLRGDNDGYRSWTTGSESESENPTKRKLEKRKAQLAQAKEKQALVKPNKYRNLMIEA